MCLNEGFSSKNFTRIWLAAICASSGFDEENGTPQDSVISGSVLPKTLTLRFRFIWLDDRFIYHYI